MPENLLGVVRSESAWIWKSPLMMSSDGDGTKIFKLILEYFKKGRHFGRWRAIDVKKDGFLVAS